MRQNCTYLPSIGRCGLFLSGCLANKGRVENESILWGVIPCLQGSGNLVPLLGPGVTPQNTDSFSSLPSLAEQLPRTKVASPDTWQTNAVLPHESIASLRCPPVFWGRSFENKLRSGCPSMRLERSPERIWMS